MPQRADVAVVIETEPEPRELRMALRRRIELERARHTRIEWPVGIAGRAQRLERRRGERRRQRIVGAARFEADPRDVQSLELRQHAHLDFDARRVLHHDDVAERVGALARLQVQAGQATCERLLVGRRNHHRLAELRHARRI
jgi:hypothetical protein